MPKVIIRQVANSFFQAFKCTNIDCLCALNVELPQGCSNILAVTAAWPFVYFSKWIVMAFVHVDRTICGYFSAPSASCKNSWMFGWGEDVAALTYFLMPLCDNINNRSSPKAQDCWKKKGATAPGQFCWWGAHRCCWAKHSNSICDWVFSMIYEIVCLYMNPCLGPVIDRK